MRQRDFAAEYARRLAKGYAKGLSRSQARGHARASEPPVRASTPSISDDRLQIALRVLRQDRSLAKAAKASKIAPERLRRVLSIREVAEKAGNRWKVREQLPRRVLIYSQGAPIAITVGTFEAASLAGKYMSAVGEFLRTNRVSLLAPFAGVVVRDVKQKGHVLETRPNALYRAASANDHSFEQIYRIVI